MKDYYYYPAIFNYAEDGISVSFPDLPGCLTCAHDTDTAHSRAREALGLHLYGMERDGDPIPEPSGVNALTLEEGDIPVLIETYMPSIRARVKHTSVKKTLTIPAWLNAEAERAGINFSQVLQDSLKQILHAQ